MTKKFSQEVRKDIHCLKDQGKSVKEILEILKKKDIFISDKSIYRILQEEKNVGSFISENDQDFFDNENTIRKKLTMILMMKKKKNSTSRIKKKKKKNSMSMRKKKKKKKNSLSMIKKKKKKKNSLSMIKKRRKKKTYRTFKTSLKKESKKELKKFYQCLIKT